jgi:hypothetical protein
MSMHLRLARFPLGLASTLAVLALIPSPASAVTAPDWPASRVPTGPGCAITGYTPYTSSASGLNEYTFVDTQLPAVTAWSVNNSRTWIALPPGQTLATFRIVAAETCTGVARVASGLVVRGVRISDDYPFLRATSDAFNGTWSTGVTVGPDDAGDYRLPTVNVVRRYSSVVLTDAWSLVGKTDESGAATTVTGTWSTQAVYLLRATTQVTSASRSTVKKGGKVTFRTAVRKAATSSYVPAAGISVVLQTRVPGGAWLTRARVTTNSSGAAAYTFAPSRTMQWRWVHAGTRSGGFTAPSTSVARTIKVT